MTTDHPVRPPGGPPHASGPPAAMTTPRDRTRTETAAEQVSAAHSSHDSRRCWRCGQPIAWTDEAALARCYELATQPVEERQAAGLCRACAAAAERQQSVYGETAVTP